MKAAGILGWIVQGLAGAVFALFLVAALDPPNPASDGVLGLSPFAAILGFWVIPWVVVASISIWQWTKGRFWVAIAGAAVDTALFTILFSL